MVQSGLEQLLAVGCLFFFSTTVLLLINQLDPDLHAHFDKIQLTQPAELFTTLGPNQSQNQNTPSQNTDLNTIVSKGLTEYNPEFEVSKLPRQHKEVLSLLLREDTSGFNQETIANRLDLSAPQTSTLLSQMANDGIIVKQPLGRENQIYFPPQAPDIIDLPQRAIDAYNLDDRDINVTVSRRNPPEKTA